MATKPRPTSKRICELEARVQAAEKARDDALCALLDIVDVIDLIDEAQIMDRDVPRFISGPVRVIGLRARAALNRKRGLA